MCKIRIRVRSRGHAFLQGIAFARNGGRTIPMAA